MVSDAVVACTSLCKSYHDGTTSVEVLKSIDFSIQSGDRIAIVGPSGSGKSTFLHLLGGLDKPTSGFVYQQGVDWQTLSEKKRCKLRNKQLGFIYQFHYLLPEFSALENVAMPLLLGGESLESANNKAVALLEHVGLGARTEHKPSQLSGGERQRVAIARALIHKPQCVFADEPTGNLDQATAIKVFEMMLDLNQDFKTALIIVTHDTHLASRMDKVMSLKEGRLT